VQFQFDLCPLADTLEKLYAQAGAGDIENSSVHGFAGDRESQHLHWISGRMAGFGAPLGIRKGLGGNSQSI